MAFATATASAAAADHVHQSTPKRNMPARLSTCVAYATATASAATAEFVMTCYHRKRSAFVLLPCSIRTIALCEFFRGRHTNTHSRDNSI